MGYAFLIGVELVAERVVGGGIGWLLDKLFGTLPLFLILFFFLGSAAGILNVYRAARQMERAEAKDDEGSNYASATRQRVGSATRETFPRGHEGPAATPDGGRYWRTATASPTTERKRGG